MRIFATTIAVFIAFSMSTPAQVLASDDLKAALENPNRPEADRARDAGRKPVQVLEFLGIGEGDVVLDLMAASGWYTEVLSIAVGATGTVYSQNPAANLLFRDGANDKALAARLANDRLPNVIRLDSEFDKIGVATGTLDAAITAMNIHDIYNSSPQAAEGLLAVIKVILKPGGILGIIDHAGVAGADNAALHRVEVAKIKEIAISAGFEIVGESDVLANPDDDGSTGVFGADMRGNTNRFLLKLKAPE